MGRVFVIAGGLALLCQRDARTGMGLRYGALTGLFIAAYTVCDGYAVQAVLVAPLLLDYAANVLRCAFLTPRTLRYKAELEREWRRNKWHAITIGAIAPLGYILVLTAMKTAPISAVAPLREMSMLVGASFGAKLLGEGKVWQRVAGAGLIALGVVGLRWGEGVPSKALEIDCRWNRTQHFPPSVRIAAGKFVSADSSGISSPGAMNAAYFPESPVSPFQSWRAPRAEPQAPKTRSEVGESCFCLDLCSLHA